MITTLLRLGFVAYIAGILVPAFGPGRVRKMNLSLFFCILASLLVLIASASIIYTGQEFRESLGETARGFSMVFLIDRLSAFFIATISIVAVSASVYSLGYFKHMTEKKSLILVSLMNLFILSMDLVVASENLFAFLFFWETMSISSFFLVMHDYSQKESRKAGLFYLIMTQLSTAFLFYAFLGTYSQTGSLALNTLANASPAIALALFAGFGIKAGIVPLHKWLPYAHTAAPSNISALMSGVMIKVAIYGLIRFSLNGFARENWWGILLIIAGSASALLGVIYALKEHDLKRLLAYCSIENIGVILIGLGTYCIFFANGLEGIAVICLAGTLLHVLNHALFKSLLFMTAGSVIESTGKRNMEALGGLMKKMPYTSALFLVGSVCVSALPPFNGFVSEYLIFQGLLQGYSLTHAYLKIITLASMSVFALTSALGAACFVKAFGITFLAAPRSENAKNAKEQKASMIVGPAIPAALCLLIGVFAYRIGKFLGYDLPLPDMSLAGAALILTSGVTYMCLRLFSENASRTTRTWDCGAPLMSSRTEYSAAGFSEPLVTVFKSTYQTRKESEQVFYDPERSLVKGGSARIHLIKLFEERIYLPIGLRVDMLSKRIANLENNDTDTYLLYCFIAVVALIISLGWLA